MSASPEKREHLYKILVIGELGTGKTSFIKRYVHQFFSQNYRATIGVDFALKVLNWDANTIIRLQLWDIAGEYMHPYSMCSYHVPCIEWKWRKLYLFGFCLIRAIQRLTWFLVVVFFFSSSFHSVAVVCFCLGQERFGNMTRVYYKEAVGAFIVFDVTRSATFDAVIKWKQDLDSKVQLPNGSPIPCILLANKVIMFMINFNFTKKPINSNLKFFRQFSIESD